MSNGRTELDREGCEFGRQLKKDNDYLKEDVREIKGDLKELIKKVDKIAQQVDRANISRKAESANKGGGSRK